MAYCFFGKFIDENVDESARYTVWLNPPSPRFSDIFPKRLGIFSPNFICLLYVPIYAGLQIFIQLSVTLTKLCNIERDHHAQNVHRRLKRTLGGRT